MNFGVIATGNHCDFNALRAAPPSLHDDGNLPDFCVIARSEATWQSPGPIHRSAVQSQTSYREIATAPLGPRNDSLIGTLNTNLRFCPYFTPEKIQMQ